MKKQEADSRRIMTSKDFVEHSRGTLYSGLILRFHRVEWKELIIGNNLCFYPHFGSNLNKCPVAPIWGNQSCCLGLGFWKVRSSSTHKFIRVTIGGKTISLAEWLRRSGAQLGPGVVLRSFWRQEYTPAGATWVQARVRAFDKEAGLHEVTTEGGGTLRVWLATQLLHWGPSRPEPGEDLLLTPDALPLRPTMGDGELVGSGPSSRKHIIYITDSDDDEMEAAPAEQDAEEAAEATGDAKQRSRESQVGLHRLSKTLELALASLWFLLLGLTCFK